jgi:argininosuccinate lyase
MPMERERQNREEWLRSEGTAFPGKTYVECLLKPLFNDQRDTLFDAMIQVHRAHVVMLCDRRILKKAEAARILRAVEEVARTDPKELQYDPRYEDLFFLVEDKIAERVGEELAGNMHIARSRNDMGVAMYRIALRERILALIEKTLSLREALLETSEEHAETVMPAYTHTQPAQPTTLGHYLLAVQDGLARDTVRLRHAFHQVNRSPLGSAAITTTGFDICRDTVRDALGFDDLVENSYDAIAGADYLGETATAVALLMTNLGRWIQDLLLFCTREFQAVRVADPYVQISSIMPQKRNPVSVEHSRSLASSAVADALAVLTMIHNTPFGDVVDTEDDLQPHLYRAIDKSQRVLGLMTAVIRTLEVNRDRLRRRAREGAITITEWADTMVREKGVPLRLAHRIASRIAQTANRENRELDELTPEQVRKAVKGVVDVELHFTEEELTRLSDPLHFIQVRKCQGGPNPEETRRMLRTRREQMVREKDWLNGVWENLHQAEARLMRRVNDLIKES